MLLPSNILHCSRYPFDICEFLLDWTNYMKFYALITGSLKNSHPSQGKSFISIIKSSFKGGYLDFSRLTELEKNIYPEIYMRKQSKYSITKNHKIKQTNSFGVVP